MTTFKSCFYALQVRKEDCGVIKIVALSQRRRSIVNLKSCLSGSGIGAVYLHCKRNELKTSKLTSLDLAKILGVHNCVGNCCVGNEFRCVSGEETKKTLECCS